MEGFLFPLPTLLCHTSVSDCPDRHAVCLNNPGALILMKVAVRSLCEFAARNGSLEFRYTPSPTSEEGIRGHKKLQSRRGDHYQAEHLLEGSFAGIQLKGRADGYIPPTPETDERPVPLLEEIKTHRGELSRIPDGLRQLHLAQLKVYGALLCLRDHLERVSLRLVYFDIDNDQETPDEAIWQTDTLIRFAETLCQRYKHWHQQEAKHRQRRDEAIHHLAFPYPNFRPYQRELSEVVYKGIYTQRPLLLEAPTGLGKTLGVSFPAIKALATCQLDRLFLLSSRTTGRQLFMDALRSLSGHENIEPETNDVFPLRILELSAKEKTCEHPDKACHGDSCPLAEGFFDRLPDARNQAAKACWLDQAQIRRIALQHAICPYYLTQEMARWSDLVVGDVNHYFDRQAILFSLTTQNDWKVVPLIDEAHNLIDRARGMYSAGLDRALFSQSARHAPETLKKPIQAVQQGWRKLIEAEASGQTEAVEQLPAGKSLSINLEQVPDQLNGYLHQLTSKLTEYLTEHAPPPEQQAQLQQLLFDTLNFLKLAELFDDHSLCRLQLSKGQPRYREPKVKARLQIMNLIPAEFLRERFSAAYASVSFSATLNPDHYYRDLLGLSERETVTQQKAALWFSLPGPFKPRQLDLRLVPISTRFRDRARSVSPLCQRIAHQYQQKPGNYLVYLSSFSYLQLLKQGLEQQCPNIPLQIQTPGMSENERHHFINRFRTQQGQIGLAVLGGAFSEGIDLPGKALIGVFVATLGLPPYDDFHEVLSTRLDKHFGDGYRYTYLYPGLRKVIQAAGRLIRTPEDTGVIELIDDRFLQPDIQALMPRWWFETSGH